MWRRAVGGGIYWPGWNGRGGVLQCGSVASMEEVGVLIFGEG